MSSITETRYCISDHLLWSGAPLAGGRSPLLRTPLPRSDTAPGFLSSTFWPAGHQRSDSATAPRQLRSLPQVRTWKLPGSAVASAWPLSPTGGSLVVSGIKRAVASAFTLLLYQFRLIYLRAVVGLETDPAGASLAFLRLAGDPVRWRLLQELARSDRRVNELTGLLGEPQNLVSYHLAKLRSGRLVSARRSSADGRDSYYTVDLSAGGRPAGRWTGRSLHPGCFWCEAAGTPRVPETLLIRRRRGCCSCALAIAPGHRWREALAESRSGRPRAGAQRPKQAQAAAPQCGTGDAGGRGLTSARAVPGTSAYSPRSFFDYVITLCDRVREVCPSSPAIPATSTGASRNPAASGASDGADLSRYSGGWQPTWRRGSPTCSLAWPPPQGRGSGDERFRGCGGPRRAGAYGRGC